MSQQATLTPPTKPDAGSDVLGQEEIEALLDEPGDTEQPAEGTTPAEGDSLAQADVEALLRLAEDALASADAPCEGSGNAPEAFRLEAFDGSPASADIATLEPVRDLELDVRIELGRTHLPLEAVSKLHRGSVVALDKLAGDPVDIFVNGRLIARGDVLVLNESFCVRVNELVAAQAVQTA